MLKAPPPFLIPCLMLLTASLSGCGAGIVAAIIGGKSLSNESSDGSNSPTLVSEVRLSNARISPATISFILSDAESDPADVEVSYRWSAGRAATGSPAAKSGLIARQNALSSSPGGTRHEMEWDFKKDLGEGLTSGLTVSVSVAGGQASLLSEQAIGNDPPEILDVRPPEGKVVGIAKVDFRVLDSSSDSVKIIAKYHVAGVHSDDPDDPSVPFAIPSGSPLEGILSSPEGKELNFFWDVVRNLGRQELEVKLSFKANDGQQDSNWVTTDPFRIDNNERPVATLFAEEFVQSPDQRRGIPVHFEVRDGDNDLVQVIFQWRLAGQSFPELPEDPSGIAGIVADPRERAHYHIAAERPIVYQGRVLAVDPAEDPRGLKVRLPELASSAAGLLAKGTAGREIEILRASEVPVPHGGGWDLKRPVAVIPIDDGTRALVLDEPSPGAWRLRKMELGTGAEVSGIAAGSDGSPSAMAHEPLNSIALVALHRGEVWKVLRLDVESGESNPLVTAPPTLALGPVRAMAVLGTGTALMTVGSALVRLGFSDSEEPKVAVLLDGLEEPWGIAVDPQRPNRIYLSEHGWRGPSTNGRIIVVDLNTLAKTYLQGRGELALERPESLVLERSGTRILAVTDAGGDGLHELRGLDIGDQEGGEVFDIAAGFPGEVGNLALGPDGLRTLALSSQNAVAVGGGLLSKRTVVDNGYDPSLQEITVDRAFDPRPASFDRWRVIDRQRFFRASPSGTRGIFVWNSSDLPQGGMVVLRAVPFDSERGIASDSAVPRRLEGTFPYQPRVLGNLTAPQFVVAADLDGDGDAELVSANGNNVALFFQKEPDESTLPVILGPVPGPRAVAAADLDGDAKTDLATANQVGSNLTVFFQQSSGGFDTGPNLTLGGRQSTDGARALEAADLNGDGNLDLISANSSGDSLTVFIQKGQRFGTFETIQLKTPRTLGPGGVASADLNGDGLLDLASANVAGNNLTVFLQKAVGIFEPTAPLSDVQEPRSVTAADVNGDGNTDLVSANQGGNNIAVFLQKGIGSFGGSPDLVLGNSATTAGPRSATAADIDGDHRLDLISANVEGSNLTVFLQKGDGTFGSLPDLTVEDPESLKRPVSVVAAELDGDGQLDLASANSAANSISLFLHQHRAEYSQRAPDVVVGGHESSDGPNSLVAGDLDGDGDLDLASANWDNNSLSLFFQGSPGVFDENPTVIVLPSTTDQIGQQVLYRPIWITAADMDGDGELDLASANNLGQNLTLFFQTGPGRFNSTPEVTLPVIGYPLTLLPADLNGDGRVDLVSGNARNLMVFTQVNPGQFKLPPLTIPFPSLDEEARGLAVGDLNADADLDLVSANAGGGNYVKVYFQKEGGFSAPADLEIGGPTRALHLLLVDLDGDRRLDIVAAAPPKLTIFFQRDVAGFPAGPDLVLDVPGGNPGFISSGDLDGDGDLDLVTRGGFGVLTNSISVYLQKNPRAFGKSGGGIPDWGLAGLLLPLTPLVVDVDGDGDPDIASDDYRGDILGVYFGSHQKDESTP